LTEFLYLYEKIAKSSQKNGFDDSNFLKNDLDCILGKNETNKRFNTQIIEAAEVGPEGYLHIDNTKSINRYKYTNSNKKLKPTKDILSAIEILKNQKGPVYALIAPAFHGQFSRDITPGKLRSAFKTLGFAGMIEVALFADILTLKEALEFDRNIKTDEDFQLTSCCCPIWIAMIRKIHAELMPHVPGSVSPMIAAGRAIKLLKKDAITIFIGPCIAKKAEAKEKDLLGDVDLVLTFQEAQDIFGFFDVFPQEMPDNFKDHSSWAGRIYARSGGVSEAIAKTLEKLNPSRTIKLKSQMAQGIKHCKSMIEEIRAGAACANFFEGMGCTGGCVGGPKAILNSAIGAKNIEEYGDEATFETPIDNPYVIKLLHELGFDTVEQLLEDNKIFTRKF
jgi:iron only hydrogenase large subunit-like protein